MQRIPLSLLAILCLASAGPLEAAGPEDASETGNPTLLVFAAASLTNVLGDLTAAWEKTSGVPVKLSFAASSVLARQIEAGGRADVFICADQEWMDYLQQRRLIRDSTRRNIARNHLVLIAPAGSGTALRISPGFDLAAALGRGRLAVGDPDTVPAGRYARAALQSLGAWEGVQGRLVPADNVRSALMYVARGEVPFGIVYLTDALIDPRVRVVDTFPEQTHSPITYPAATLQGSRSVAVTYLQFLAGTGARVIWKQYGFAELEP